MEHLVALFDGNLLAHGAARAQSEAQLTALLRTPSFALQLCEFLFGGSAVSAQASTAHRQFACLLLKRLVTAHWTPADDSDEDEDADDSADAGAAKLAGDYVVADAEKAQVRHALVVALQSSADVLPRFAESKLQTALCMTLTAIFERDWPDQWPELLPVILAMLSSSDRLALQVAIRFLSHASSHFSSDHCCELVSVVFPQLQRVFIAHDDFESGVRSRVVRIVESTLLMVGMEAHVGNKAAQQLLQENVSPWISLLLAELPRPIVASVKEYGVKVQVLRSLSKFVEEWPKQMADLLPELVPQVYALLTQRVEAYEREVVLRDDNEAGNDEDAYDSDGEGTHIGRSAVVVAALEFMRATLHAPTKKTRQLIVAGLGDFVYVMIAYMQITASQVEMWEDDPNRYIADEDDESASYSIRNAATDLLVELESVLGRKAVAPALDAAQPMNKNSVAGAEINQLLDVNTFLQTLFQLVFEPLVNILDVVDDEKVLNAGAECLKWLVITMLDFVFATWIEKQQDFYGLYCIKVTISALLKVAEWNDPRVMNIVVAGSEIEDGQDDGIASAAGVQTRSKTKKMPGVRVKQYMRVHFLTKLFVVLAKVSSHLGEDEDEWESSDDESGDDDDEVDFDHSVSVTGSIFAPAEGYELLSDRLDSSAGAVGDDVEDIGELEEEFEAHFDPLNDVDLKVCPDSGYFAKRQLQF
ncbi:hypothetical protein ATCC90586_008072 [Pythium insidiosum]|nr:hypothetical protein ATCC90586_008072 [Pythium insidiosum]